AWAFSWALAGVASGTPCRLNRGDAAAMRPVPMIDRRVRCTEPSKAGEPGTAAGLATVWLVLCPILDRSAPGPRPDREAALHNCVDGGARQAAAIVSQVPAGRTRLLTSQAPSRPSPRGPDCPRAN